jgi:hypothetical protein
VAVTDALWGGQLTSVNLDPVTHSCELVVVVTTGGTRTEHHIRCDQVSAFHFQNSIAEPWDYAEVTEAELATDDVSGLQTLELMLWSERSGLTITGTSIQVVAG